MRRLGKKIGTTKYLSYSGLNRKAIQNLQVGNTSKYQSVNI